MKVEYSANNSGGNWWLEDKDWFALEQAGWKVKWYRDSESSIVKKFSKRSVEESRFLGSLANGAEKEFETPKEALLEFESITGADVSVRGCGCCGAPHAFSWGEGDKYGYVSGSDCLTILYDEDAHLSPRELLAKIRDKQQR